MVNSRGKDQNILITGGTSGLGLELVRFFLKQGYNVFATGRQKVSLIGFESRFTLLNIDFSDLKEVSTGVKTICTNHSFSLVINNAGILSPPSYTETADGYEYTFQVNFLAHLLINEIIVNSINNRHKIKIVTITSPVYRFASLHPGIEKNEKNYRPMRSYSTSKLCLAMMPDLLSTRHNDAALMCFSFDPGTFSSGIYRMQKRWFRALYRVAAPFMRSSAGVAKVLAELISEDETVSGRIYDRSKNIRTFPEMDTSQKAAFTESCYALIDRFLK